jgi:transcription elongation factor GreA
VISRADVIDPLKLKGSETIKFSATVTVYDDEIDEEMKYQIVGQEEADLAHRRLSVTAPISRALMGKKVGDAVEVITPKGKRTYEVVKLEYLAES